MVVPSTPSPSRSWRQIFRSHHVHAHSGVVPIARCDSRNTASNSGTEPALAKCIQPSRSHARVRYTWYHPDRHACPAYYLLCPPRRRGRGVASVSVNALASQSETIRALTDAMHGDRVNTCVVKFEPKMHRYQWTACFLVRQSVALLCVHLKRFAGDSSRRPLPRTRFHCGY